MDGAGNEFPLTISPPGIDEIIESLKGVGIEVVPGESTEYVIAEEPDGKRYKLPKDFNIFTNPIKIPIEENGGGKI
ncbi:MAG: hypothetical protein E7576_07615 [Ruminococcaceae bacterium]|nr:hypothetical protein [Oscillospiraceae bacterium]